MVNEAVRRRASTVRDASKPLSLEYMGDRLDVDDGDLYKPTRLELLELQHDQRRAAAAEIRGAYGF